MAHNRGRLGLTGHLDLTHAHKYGRGATCSTMRYEHGVGRSTEYLLQPSTLGSRRRIPASHRPRTAAPTLTGLTGDMQWKKIPRSPESVTARPLTREAPVPQGASFHPARQQTILRDPHLKTFLENKTELAVAILENEPDCSGLVDHCSDKLTKTHGHKLHGFAMLGSNEAPDGRLWKQHDHPQARDTNTATKRTAVTADPPFLTWRSATMPLRHQTHGSHVPIKGMWGAQERLQSSPPPDAPQPPAYETLRRVRNSMVSTGHRSGFRYSYPIGNKF